MISNIKKYSIWNQLYVAFMGVSMCMCVHACALPYSTMYQVIGTKIDSLLMREFMFIWLGVRLSFLFAGTIGFRGFIFLQRPFPSLLLSLVFPGNYFLNRVWALKNFWLYSPVTTQESCGCTAKMLGEVMCSVNHWLSKLQSFDRSVPLFRDLHKCFLAFLFLLSWEKKARWRWNWIISLPPHWIMF